MLDTENGRAVIFAATPSPGGIAIAAAIYPGVVSGGGEGQGDDESEKKPDHAAPVIAWRAFCPAPTFVSERVFAPAASFSAISACWACWA